MENNKNERRVIDLGPIKAIINGTEEEKKNDLFRIMREEKKRLEIPNPDFDKNRTDVDKKALFAKAMSYACLKHATQMRKNGDPYIWHPVRVAKIVKDSGFGFDYQIAALLHDTLEDTDATEEEIRGFGENVLEAVKLLTRRVDNEEEYVRLVLSNHISAVVKSADIICNMLDSGELGKTPEYRFWSQNYKNKTKKYYFGKLCSAVDNAINACGAMIYKESYSTKEASVNIGSIDLYSDIEKRKYLEAKKRFESKEYNLESKPSKNDVTEAKYFTYYDTCYLYYGDNWLHSEMWKLEKEGWVRASHNPLLNDEYGDYTSYYNKEDFYKIVDGLIEKGYFYDFVDTTKL